MNFPSRLIDFSNCASRFKRGAFFIVGGLFVLASCDESGPELAIAEPERVDARPDFDPEVFQEEAREQLAQIVYKLAGDGEESLAGMVVDPAQGVAGSLRPPEASANLTSAIDTIKVWQWGTEKSDSLQGLRESFAELKKGWPEGSTPRLKVKNHRVQLGEDGRSATTQAIFQAYAAGDEFSIEQEAQWLCSWQLPEAGESLPRLVSIKMLELEEVRSEHGGQDTLFAEITLPVLENLPAFQKSLKYGANHWITRLPQLKHRFHHGLSVADVDGDGIEDVYLCQPEGLPNLLLLRQPDSSVREAARDFGLDFLDNSTSSIFADLDNDGDQDLVIAFRSPLGIFENVDGHFVRRFDLPHLGQIFSLTSADYNEDGLLDIYVCRYQNFDDLGRALSAIPLHDAMNGGENALLKNLGNWKFEDATKESGLGHNNHGWTTAASFEDYDRDGDLDLYVANDYGRNNLYRCDQIDGVPHYTDIAAEAGVEDMTTSMGISWGDPNRDGRPDIYVSNMYSSAGRRITTQKDFKRSIAGSDEAHVKAWQNASLGNSLFQQGPQTGSGSFLHTSEAAGIQKGLWSWGTVFADLNHDGWEDLLVSNGFITGPGKAPDL